MTNNYTHERIPRRASCLQWDGTNNAAVYAILAQHDMAGELFRDEYIQVYFDGSYDTTIHRGSWLLVGEDGILRIYTDEQHKLMYRPIVKTEELGVKPEELERLRAFARDVLSLECGVYSWASKMAKAEKHGITADSLKEPT